MKKTYSKPELKTRAYAQFEHVYTCTNSVGDSCGGVSGDDNGGYQGDRNRWSWWWWWRRR
jgi:hypothetical protein